MSFWKSLFGTPAEPVPTGCPADRFDTPYADAINAHFEKEFPDRAPLVWKDADGMEIHLLAPTEKEPWYVAYTVGMSAHLMELDNVGNRRKYGYLRTAELMMYLPADWPMAGLLARREGEEPDRETCWPLRMLYKLSRMPQAQNTWLGAGHTVPNGEPPHALADNTDFCGAALFLPADGNGPHEIQPVPVSQDQSVLLYVVVPVYKEELELKQLRGAEALESDLRMLPNHSGFIVDIHRRNLGECFRKPTENSL